MAERIRRKMTGAERREMESADRELQAELPKLREISESIPARKVIQLRVTEEIHAALSDYCAEHQTDLSDLVREAALRKIGRKDLLSTMPSRGRPKAS